LFAHGPGSYSQACKVIRFAHPRIHERDELTAEDLEEAEESCDLGVRLNLAMLEWFKRCGDTESLRRHSSAPVGSVALRLDCTERMFT
jgi:hypothetical protein